VWLRATEEEISANQWALRLRKYFVIKRKATQL